MGRPQMPSPPSILASSRTPICRSSMRVWNTRGQILDQLPEIHPAVGREIEEDLGVVEGVFHTRPASYPACARRSSAGRCGTRPFRSPRCPPRGAALLVAVATRITCLSGEAISSSSTWRTPVTTSSVFHAAGGFHDHAVPCRGPELAGIKIVQLSGIFEPDAYDCRHVFMFLQYCHHQLIHGGLPVHLTGLKPLPRQHSRVQHGACSAPHRRGLATARPFATRRDTGPSAPSASRRPVLGSSA